MPRLYFFLLLDRLSYVAFKSTTTNGYFLILEQAILVAVVPRLTSCWSLFVYACGRNVINLPSYPPTPNHLVVLLSAFRTHEASDPVPLDSKATLDSVPSLLVLHELSAYFLPMNENKPHTIASYLQLVSYALALSSFLSPESQTPMRFALFDSQLDKLKLPVLRTPTVPVFDGEESGDETPRPESVAFVAHKYFEWVGTFDRSDTNSLSDGSEVRRCTLTLHKQGSDIRSDIVWRWSEVPERAHSRCEGLAIAFSW